MPSFSRGCARITSHFGASFTVAFLLFASIASAEPSFFSPEMDLHRMAGFNALYNMEYEPAAEQFREMIRLDSAHPAGYIYLASSVWLRHLASLRRLQTQIYNRNDSFFVKANDTVDPAVDRQFQDLITKGMQLAESQLKKNKNDVAALYFLGVAKGALAGYESTVKRSFFSSLRNGSRAVALHREALKRDPNFTDAYLSVGMYDYVLGSLPLAVKILAFVSGHHGSKKEGLKELEKVYKEGKFARVEAGVILILLYDREKRLEDSLKIQQVLSAQYSRNSIFRSEMARTLARLGRYRQSVKLYEELLNDPVALDYMPDLIHYQYAETLFELNLWEKAYHHYMVSSGFSKAPESLITMSHLEAGKCLDALQKRELALKEYQFVLNRAQAFHSREQAQKYLKTPFVPEGQEKQP